LFLKRIEAVPSYPNTITIIFGLNSHTFFYSPLSFFRNKLENSTMAFWGCAVKAGKEAPFVPSPEADEKLHVSQACMAPGASKNAKATLMIRVGDNEEPLAVAALKEGATESVALDLVLDQYTEFSVIGNATVHLTGYYMPEYAIDGDGGEDDDEEEGDEPYTEEELQAMNDQILGFDENGIPIIAGEYDSEDDSDFDSEDMDDLENGLDDLSDDEFDSAEEDLLNGEDGGVHGRRKSGVNVVIEDITDVGAANGKKAAAAEFDDEDVSGSDEEESDEEEDESESEEEEEEEPAPQPEKKKPAAKNNKRKAEEEKPAIAAVAEKKKKEDPAKIKKETTVAKNEDKKIVAGQVASGNKRVRRYANGFEVEDVKMGSATGKLAKPGKTVLVRYVGRLKNGTVFDQTKGKATFKFRLGVGEVIKGWDRGVEGMRVGDKRKLIIPPVMGYGSSKTGPIPPNSELHFDVELVDVK
jgi:FK506-binding nuclear protein